LDAKWQADGAVKNTGLKIRNNSERHSTELEASYSRRPGLNNKDGQEMLRAELKESVGKRIKVTLGGQTDTVLIVAVDPDGFICRPMHPDPQEASPEFWVAYKEVSGIEHES
jgi:hypothetical protein